MPVLQRHLRLEVGAGNPPAGPRQFVDVAVVAVFHHPVDADAPVAVAVGVFEHQDSVASLTSVFLAAVVDYLADPDAAGSVDVDVRRAGKQRLGREKGGLEPVGQGQRLDGTCRSERPGSREGGRESDGEHEAGDGSGVPALQKLS